MRPVSFDAGAREREEPSSGRFPSPQRIQWLKCRSRHMRGFHSLAEVAGMFVPSGTSGRAVPGPAGPTVQNRCDCLQPAAGIAPARSHHGLPSKRTSGRFLRPAHRYVPPPATGVAPLVMRFFRSAFAGDLKLRLDAAAGHRATLRCSIGKFRTIPVPASVQRKRPLVCGLNPCIYSFRWWRWRESNPRPKALHPRHYMLSAPLGLVPRQHGAQSASGHQPVLFKP